MLKLKAEDRITSSDVVKKPESIQKEILDIPALIDELGENNILTWYCRYCTDKDNFIESFKLIIEYEVNVNSVDELGNNALHILCRHHVQENLIEIIRILIEKGIDVNCKNSNGDTALTLLCANYKDKHVTEKDKKNVLLDEIVKLLIRHGFQITDKNYEVLQKRGFEDRNGKLGILKFMAQENLTLGWHPNCNSCEHILSVEESARRKVQHHQMFGNAYVAFHMILRDLQAWEKSTRTSTEADQDDPTGRLCTIAQNHFTDPDDKECFATMVKVSEQVNRIDSSLFQCNLYEHYLRSLHRIACLIEAEKSKKQIEFFNLLPFDYALVFPLDKMHDQHFKRALGEWDKTLFRWMHKSGDEYFGKYLKKDAMKDLLSSENSGSLDCHGQIGTK